jgi:hypothetical protein
MNKTPVLLIALLGFITAWTACSPVEDPPEENDKLLARTYNKTLYLSEVRPLIPADSSPEDSLLRLNALVEQWLRDALLMHEAEKNIPKDLNIDKLVRDYRSSLILHNYEKVLVENLLDTTVTDGELGQYYDENRKQYKLESPILRCYLIQFPMGLPEEEQLKQQWLKIPGDSTGMRKVKDFSIDNASTILLNDSLWYRKDRILNLFPEGKVSDNDLSSGTNLQFQEEGFNIWCKVLETRKEGEFAPLSFVEPQIRKLILHKRKLDLLHTTREEIYDQEIRRNNIKVYID